MTRVLYVNHGHGDRCGVWNYGDRHFKALESDGEFTFVSVNVVSEEEFDQAFREVNPGVVIFNYAPIVMPWVGPQISRYRVPKIVMVHNYEQSTLSSIADNYAGMFDYVACLDPTIVTGDYRVFALSRPIPEFNAPASEFTPDGDIQIGSFGFALHHKQFPLMMREINRCFDTATFNLHMTEGRFAAGLTQPILEACLAEITKPGIKLNHTADYLSEDEVVAKLAKNHINALFYNWPPHNAGLSSSTDFLIAAQRPMLLSDCAMFNHVRVGSFQYPNVTFTDILEDLRNCELEAANLYARTRGHLDAETKEMLRSVI